VERGSRIPPEFRVIENTQGLLKLRKKKEGYLCTRGSLVEVTREEGTREELPRRAILDQLPNKETFWSIGVRGGPIRLLGRRQPKQCGKVEVDVWGTEGKSNKKGKKQGHPGYSGPVKEDRKEAVLFDPLSFTEGGR